VISLIKEPVCVRCNGVHFRGGKDNVFLIDEIATCEKLLKKIGNF
jgi:hypothetical protein